MRSYQRSKALLIFLPVPIGCSVSEPTSLTCTDVGYAAVVLMLEDSTTGCEVSARFLVIPNDGPLHSLCLEDMTQ